MQHILGVTEIPCKSVFALLLLRFLEAPQRPQRLLGFFLYSLFWCQLYVFNEVVKSPKEDIKLMELMDDSTANLAAILLSSSLFDWNH